MATKDIPIIDVDTHYNEPLDLWTSRAPDHLRDRVPRVEVIEGVQQWVIEKDTLVMPWPGVCVIRDDGSKFVGDVSLSKFDEMHKAATDPRERLKWMDEHGIHAQVIYPNLVAFGIDAIIDNAKDLELVNFCATAWNDYMIEVQTIGNGRLFPQALIPVWDPELAVKEAIRCHEAGLTGLNVPSAPESHDLPSLSNPIYDPLWRVAEDRDMMINFHIGTGGVNLQTWDMEFSNAFAAGSTVAITSNLRALANLIFSGVLDRFPKLKFCSVESGFGWIPFFLDLCEYQYDECGVTNLKMRPKEYFKRQIYASYWFEKKPQAAIDLLGIDNVMFETDFPHPTCLYPNIHEHIESSLSGLSDVDQRKILCENAARLYHIPMPDAA